MQPTTRRMNATAAALLMLTAAAAAQPQNLNGRVELRLDGAVFQSPEQGVDLWVDLTCRDGAWSTDAWGWGWNFNRAEHFGTANVIREGDTYTVSLLMDVDSDPWVKGDLAPYTLELRFDGDAVRGRYQGTFRGERVAGDVEGAVRPLGEPAEGYEPPAPGEHPRLLFRRSDLPELKARAETEWGRKLIERIRQREKDPLAMGLMYRLTGEQKYADRCRDILTRDRHDFSGGPFNTGHYHGPRQMRMGMTLDLAWDGLDEQFRSMIAGYLWYYNSRSLLRPSHMAAKTNQAPGSNYMGKLIPGAYTSQAAVWDAPGAFPPRPAEPKMVELSPSEGFSPEEGVPVVALRNGETVGRWLFAGPFAAWKYREDYLVLTKWREAPDAGSHYQHWHQDHMVALGGCPAARPEPGTKVPYHGRTRTFAGWSPGRTAGEVTLDVWSDCDDVPCAAGYYYTVLETDADGWYTLLLEGLTDEARKVNRYLGDRYEQFSADENAEDHVAFRLDAEAYLSGEKLHHGDAVHLARGRYPLLVRATTRQYQVQLRPRLAATTEAAARGRARAA